MDETQKSKKHHSHTPLRSRMAVRLAGMVFLCAALVLVALMAYNYHASRNILLQEAEHRAMCIGESTGESIARVVMPVERVVQTLASALEQEKMDPITVQGMVRQALKHNPAIYGMAVAHTAYSVYPDHKYYAPYQYRLGKGIAYANLGGENYDYFSMEWFAASRASGGPHWSEPYVDEGGGEVLMTTFSVPWYEYVDGERQFAGVVTADIDLAWFDQLMSGIQIYDTGYATVLTSKGTYIYHPMKELVMAKDVFTLAKDLGDGELNMVGHNMVNGKTGFIRRKSVKGSVNSFLYYAPLRFGGWSLGLLFPEAEVMASEIALVRDMAGMSLIGLMLLAVVVFWISLRLVRPMEVLSEAAIDMSEGDLDLELPALERKDEIGAFARSFDVMRTSLKDYIHTLADTTAAKERIESELRIAREIQMSILPRIFPPYPDAPELAVCASIEPAKEVGGDLYDFFFVDDHRFYFLVGDVSDKGVPAALFMAVTKTLLGTVAEQGHPPGVVLGRVNDGLAENNESCMFVTLFLGCIDIRTGELEYACAGHDPAVLIRANGEITRLEGVREPIAGAMEGVEYTTLYDKMGPGDTILSYTDGVSEAMNHDQELFGEERLMEALHGMQASEANAVLDTVHAAVTGFVGDAVQSDDITMLTMTYVGPRADEQ